MANLAELWIARDEEHVSCDTIHEHLLARDTIVAEGEENPRNVRVDLRVVNRAQCIEQIHNALLEQELYAIS